MATREATRAVMWEATQEAMREAERAKLPMQILGHSGGYAKVTWDQFPCTEFGRIKESSPLPIPLSQLKLRLYGEKYIN